MRKNLTILARKPYRAGTPNTDSVVLLEGWNLVTPWVTYIETERGERYWGHYHFTLKEAWMDYSRRGQ